MNPLGGHVPTVMNTPVVSSLVMLENWPCTLSEEFKIIVREFRVEHYIPLQTVATAGGTE